MNFCAAYRADMFIRNNKSVRRSRIPAARLLAVRWQAACRGAVHASRMNMTVPRYNFRFIMSHHPHQQTHDHES